MSKHTPVPWKHVATQGGWDGVEEPGGQLICHLRLNNPANARFIVRACNVHDELVVALEDIREMCIPGMNWTDEIGQELLQQADKALAKAKEGS